VDIAKIQWVCYAQFMYKAFNVQAMSFKTDRNKAIGKEIYDTAKQEINIVIKSFVRNGRLNADLITADWFPEINADIFISHSHKDFDSVISIAGWLYDNFKIISFIDSCVWGYSDKLLKLIDTEYCYDEDMGLYDYNMRNLSTSHVYMMLSVALSKMIYNTEVLFFYNSPNSITPDKVIGAGEKTLSPWIYSEIAMTNLVRQRKPAEHRLIKSMSTARENFSDAKLKVEYKVNISSLPIINADFFSNWRKTVFTNKYEALDYLYQVEKRRKI
jgi:hypothetical protein